MRIAVNVRALTGESLEGIGRFTFETLKQLVSKHPEHHFIFFFDRPWLPQFVFADNITPVVVSPKAIHPVLWFIWFELRLPFFIKKYKADVLLSMDGYASLLTNVPTCMVVYDLAFFHYPQFFKKRTAVYYNFFVPKFLRKVNSIACISSFTRNDVLKYVPEKTQQTVVVGCAASGQFHPVSKEDTDAIRNELTAGIPYFFFVGALHPRKNIINLLNAFELLKRETNVPVKLVIAGRFAWKTEEIKNRIEEFAFKNDLIHLGHISSEQLINLMASSYAVVYPSIFEGFGIPILEAMLCDVPSITSNTSSMPEVGGEAALYADPLNPEELKDQMKKILEHPHLREELIIKGRSQREKFSWVITADKLWDTLLLASKQNTFNRT